VVLADYEAAATFDSRIREYLLGAGVNWRWNLLTREELAGQTSLAAALVRLLERPFALFGLQLSRTDFVLGYRLYRLEDSLWTCSDMASTRPIDSLPTGTELIYEDLFDAENEFHGGELGYVIEFRRDRWTLELTAKLALGQNRQRLNIVGNGLFIIPDQGALALDGMLAVASNEGSYSRNHFSIIPRFGIQFTRDINDRWGLFLGYELVYWPNVVLGAEQIDLAINPDYLHSTGASAEPERPIFSFRESDYWVQSLNMGVEFRF
jgi:hypothetical protein